jgi:hypothetical protein
MIIGIDEVLAWFGEDEPEAQRMEGSSATVAPPERAIDSRPVQLAVLAMTLGVLLSPKAVVPIPVDSGPATTTLFASNRPSITRLRTSRTQKKTAPMAAPSVALPAEHTLEGKIVRARLRRQALIEDGLPASSHAVASLSGQIASLENELLEEVRRPSPLDVKLRSGVALFARVRSALASKVEMASAHSVDQFALQATAAKKTFA